MNSDQENQGTPGVELAAVDDLMYTMFKDPDNFVPKQPEPSIEYYTRINIDDDDPHKKLKVNLASKHSLWGHRLWNASKACANYLDLNSDLYKNKCVLELGAGGAVPTIVCALNGAMLALATDYPEASLLDAIRINMQENALELYENKTLQCAGLPWGQGLEYLLEQNLQLLVTHFDLIIMSDLIFNHYSAESLLKTCKILIKPNSGVCLVTFSHHVPRLAHKDYEFFSIAEKKFGFMVEKICEETWTPMFPEDSAEDIKPRSTVYFYRLSINEYL